MPYKKVLLDGDVAGGTPALVGQGHWTELSTKTNIGTAYVDLYTTAGSGGLPVFCDFTGRTLVRALVLWDKIGTGTQGLRAIDADNSANVLFEIATLAAGANDTGELALPGWATGVKKIKLQGKSSVALDDPVFRGCALYLK